MSENNDWKRTEEIEIDLADLLKQLCMQWKQILLCAFAFAVLAGGFGYMKNKSSAEVQDADAVQDIELTPEEEQNILAAVQLQEEISGLEQYLDGSLLMRTDPYHKHKAYLLYSIEQADRREVQKITESYLSFVTNGGAADALQEFSKEWDVDKSYLAEIMTAYQKTYSFPYQIAVNNIAEYDMQTEYVFYVELTGPDEKIAGHLAEDMQEVMREHSAEVKKQAGSHKLRLFGAESTVVMDANLHVQQHDKRSQLAANITNLKSMTDAFSEKQLGVYEKAVEIEDGKREKETGGKDDKSENIGNENSSLAFIKYIIFGLAGGIFIYCVIFSCWYLFRDTVKSEEEMKNLYTFPFYGGISLKEREDERLISRIRLACKKQGVSKLCIASDFSFNSWEKEYMENMAVQMESFGIHIVTVEDAGRNTGLWDTMTETGNVLMVCRTGTTTHRMIDDAMRFYRENGISVMGAVAFRRDRLKNRTGL